MSKEDDWVLIESTSEATKGIYSPQMWGNKHSVTQQAISSTNKKHTDY